ncbi:MAG: 16S rRNA (adenine(1518)-N(6)/adenine(1519)-N(6))-dimethyltransferase RsmA [Prolixibacteraceae bacterium]|nr:16S rRNA (adenine(1518)-N(6)/adenine(1519)-N(6))-dimethyltransferase RsmA [Prolixibacteraceae bacterium]
MDFVRPKKGLGQHFLKDLNIARKIAGSLDIDSPANVLEIGPGMGVLTRFLLQNENINLTVVEIDNQSIDYLNNYFDTNTLRIINGDFLKMDVDVFFADEFCIIGNFPYNISSQIFFRIFEFRSRIPQVVGMIQKEVAERFCAQPGNKSYGILSVLLQAFYNIEYLFTVSENVFAPPPKVKSAVVRLKRNSRQSPGCDENIFKTVVKTAFNQRRKVLSNALKPLNFAVPSEFAGKRAEQLSVEQFIELAKCAEQAHKN